MQFVYFLTCMRKTTLPSKTSKTRLCSLSTILDDMFLGTSPSTILLAIPSALHY